MQQFIPLGWLAGSLLFAAGCQKLPVVEGDVTLDGQPLAGATIVFIPLTESRAKDAPRMASGMSDENGRFQIVAGHDKGVVPGEYKVTVSKWDIPPGVPRPVREPNDPFYGDKLAALRRESLPPKYVDPERTPLRVQVPKEGVRDLKLAVSSRKEP